MKIRNKIMNFAIALFFVATAAIAAPAKDNNADIQTAKEVRKELVKLPYYGVFDNLAYKLEGNTVTLYGQVTRPITRKDAERAVSKVEGVDHVVNNIEVLPLSTFDNELRARTYRAVFRTASLYRYAMGVNPSIHIIVKNGNVSLEGVVSSKGDSNLAYMAARGVPGSFTVTNNLRVEGK